MKKGITTCLIFLFVLNVFSRGAFIDILLQSDAAEREGKRLEQKGKFEAAQKKFNEASRLFAEANNWRVQHPNASFEEAFHLNSDNVKIFFNCGEFKFYTTTKGIRFL